MTQTSTFQWQKALMIILYADTLPGLQAPSDPEASAATPAASTGPATATPPLACRSVGVLPCRPSISVGDFNRALHDLSFVSSSEVYTSHMA